MKTLQEKLLQQNYKDLQESYRALKQKESINQIITNFAIAVLQQNTLDEIMWAIAKNAIAKLGFVDCVVYLVDDEKQILIQKAAHGPKNPIAFEIKDPITLPIGKGVVGMVAKTGVPEIVGDTSKDHPRYIIDDAIRLSELAVPIIIEGKVIGVIDSEHPNKNFYTQEHLNILTTIALMSATKISNAITKEKFEAY